MIKSFWQIVSYIFHITIKTVFTFLPWARWPHNHRDLQTLPNMKKERQTASLAETGRGQNCPVFVDSEATSSVRLELTSEQVEEISKPGFQLSFWYSSIQERKIFIALTSLRLVYLRMLRLSMGLKLCQIQHANAAQCEVLSNAPAQITESLVWDEI